MNPTMEKALRWWHVAFGVAAAFFAYQYLHDGLAEGGVAADRMKGYAWVVLALLMVVPEVLRRRHKGGDDENNGTPTTR